MIRIFRIIKIIKLGTGAKNLKELEKTLVDFYKRKGVI